MPAEISQVPQPREHKAKVCIWDDLTFNQMDAIMQTSSVDDLKRILSEIFGLEDSSQRSLALLDLYYYTVQFAKDKGFDKEQTAAFFSIVKKTHEMCIETPFGNVEMCFNYFKELVLCHAVKRPPWSVNLFKPEQVKLITNYVVNTYFRHFKLYKYVFTPLVRLDLCATYEGMPPIPEPSSIGNAAVADETKDEGKPSETTETEEKDIGEEDTEERVTEESAAERELRHLISSHVSEEVKKLKLSVDEQIKANDEELQKKINSTEGRGGSGHGKRAPSRGKKGK